MNNFVITIDTDWAPDEVIAKVSKLLAKYEIKSTWFITHNSQEIQKLKNYPNFFELGLHPNFAKDSGQGKNPRKIVKYLLKIVPDAKSVRSHGLIQSTELLKIMSEEFNICYDNSLLMPHTLNLAPHRLFFSKNMRLLRFPFFWEDDEEINRPQPLFDINHPEYQKSGLKIFNFHPIHIALNSSSMNNYEKVKNELNYPHISLEDLEPYIFKGEGIGVFFKNLLGFISKNKLKSQTISELAREFNKNDL